MPTPNFIQVLPQSTGLKVETVELVVNSNTVERQVGVIGDPTNAANYALVSSSGALKVDGSAVTQPVLIQVSPLVQATGTITTSTSTITVPCSGFGSITTSIYGTYAGVNVIFEASDNNGVSYYNVAMARVDGSGVDTTSGVLTANTSMMWVSAAAGWTHFRVRATAYTSGTGNVSITLGTQPLEPNPIVGQGGTWNIGTVSTVSNVTTVQAVSAIMAPLPAGTNLLGSVLPGAIGIGADFAVSTTLNSTAAYGQPLTYSAAKPAGAIGCAIIIPASGSITFGVQLSQPVAAFVNRPQYANPSGQLPIEIDIDLAGTAMVYITQISGAGLVARWI